MVEFCIVHLGVTEYRISSGVEADHSMDGGGLHQTVFLSWKREPICRPTRQAESLRQILIIILDHQKYLHVRTNNNNQNLIQFKLWRSYQEQHFH